MKTMNLFQNDHVFFVFASLLVQFKYNVQPCYLLFLPFAYLLIFGYLLQALDNLNSQ